MDFIFAHRPASEKLLASAPLRDTSMGRLRVVSAEGLIGFKLQAYVNNPKRTQDIEDIRALLRANHSALNMEEIRQYFRLFEREAILDELVTEAGA